jgi:glycosyltransferase involved in cell wall biosynthesis
MSECCHKVAIFGLVKQVQFWGYQPEPWRCAPSGSIFVMTSDYEGHPLVVLEAMATGHLCIIPHIPGILEIAETGEEALIYESGDEESLVDAMRCALEMPAAQRQQMIQAARSRVERDFDARRMAQQYLDLYQTLYKTRNSCIAF